MPPRSPSEHPSEPLALPRLVDEEAEAFVAEAIAELGRSQIPFLIGGTFAVSAHTGISRPTKDLDVFCKPGDYTRILNHFKSLGYAVEIEDDRWLGKVFKGKSFFDVIFSSPNGTMRSVESCRLHAKSIAATNLNLLEEGATYAYT